VVVTGGAGFIGSHLVKRLVDSGRQVRVVDDLSRGKLSNLDGLAREDYDLEISDLRSRECAKKVTSDADVVFHLAARVGNVPYLHGSREAELKAFQGNLQIDANVFSACIEFDVKRIVYASSVSVYPSDLQHQIGARFSEDDITSIEPDGGYGWAKLMGEYQLGLMEATVGVARIFSIYGACMSLDDSAQAVAMLCKKAARYPREPFIVWGSGKQTRDYLHVSDCVEALLLLEKHGGTVNVGSGHALSVGELAEKIVQVSHKPIQVEYDPSKPTGMMSRTADISKLKSMGWKQKMSLDDGLKETYSWVQSQCNLDR
jgi:nucleoside-diphosphate-sugar epimerase